MRPSCTHSPRFWYCLDNPGPCAPPLEHWTIAKNSRMRCFGLGCKARGLDIFNSACRPCKHPNECKHIVCMACVDMGKARLPLSIRGFKGSSLIFRCPVCRIMATCNECLIDGKYTCEECFKDRQVRTLKVLSERVEDSGGLNLLPMEMLDLIGKYII